MLEPTKKLNDSLRTLTLQEMWDVYRLWKAEHTPASIKQMLNILCDDVPEDVSPPEIASIMFAGLYKNGLESFRDFIKTMVK